MASRQDNTTNNNNSNDGERDVGENDQNDHAFDAELGCRDGGRNDATNEDDTDADTENNGSSLDSSIERAIGAASSSAASATTAAVTTGNDAIMLASSSRQPTQPVNASNASPSLSSSSNDVVHAKATSKVGKNDSRMSTKTDSEKRTHVFHTRAFRKGERSDSKKAASFTTNTTSSSTGRSSGNYSEESTIDQEACKPTRAQEEAVRSVLLMDGANEASTLEEEETGSLIDMHQLLDGAPQSSPSPSTHITANAGAGPPAAAESLPTEGTSTTTTPAIVPASISDQQSVTTNTIRPGAISVIPATGALSTPAPSATFSQDPQLVRTGNYNDNVEFGTDLSAGDTASHSGATVSTVIAQPATRTSIMTRDAVHEELVMGYRDMIAQVMQMQRTRRQQEQRRAVPTEASAPTRTIAVAEAIGAVNAETGRIHKIPHGTPDGDDDYSEHTEGRQRKTFSRWTFAVTCAVLAIVVIVVAIVLVSTSSSSSSSSSSFIEMPSSSLSMSSSVTA
mmetsp:Transcript_17842/g.50564  ORF Transcript_17842/g.50564 Transcript_17842/m.50564 type:complete len:509 (-) Transcript_17842:63-1589(-)